jgi:hypothetical protein
VPNLPERRCGLLELSSADLWGYEHPVRCKSLCTGGALGGSGGAFLHSAVRQCVQDQFDSIRNPQLVVDPLRQRAGAAQSTLSGCVERQIELVHIQPGKPMQNAHVESFHGRLREECLTVSWFQNLFDARQKIAAWLVEYNEARPRSSLGYRTPKEFATAMRAAEAGSALLAPPSSAANPESESVV